MTEYEELERDIRSAFGWIQEIKSPATMTFGRWFNLMSQTHQHLLILERYIRTVYRMNEELRAEVRRLEDLLDPPPTVIETRDGRTYTSIRKPVKP